MRMPPGASRRLQLLWAAFTGRLGHQTRNPLLWLTWSALLGQLAREPARSIALTWAAVLLLPDLDSWCVLVRPHEQSNAVWLCSQLTQVSNVCRPSSRADAPYFNSGHPASKVSMAKQEQPAAAAPVVPPPVPQFRHNRKQVESNSHCCQYHTLLPG